MINALIKWFSIILLRKDHLFSNYNSNLYKSIEVLNRFSAHQFYTPLFTYPTFERKNGNDENKTVFTYSYASLDWTKSYVYFLYSDISTFLLYRNYFIISTRKRSKFFLSDLFNFTNKYQDRNEGDTRVFYHLERSTKYLARCARRDTIKIVTYYEASEKDLNYACQFKVRLMCHALMEKLFRRCNVTRYTIQRQWEERERREREGEGGREREKSTNSEISAFRIETHARQTRPRPFQPRSSLAPLGQSWSCALLFSFPPACRPYI